MDEIQPYLDTLPDTVTDNIEVVTPDTLDQKLLYHISMTKGVRFSPVVSQRTMNKENRSIPRVSVSSSLLGCILGYMKDDWDYTEPIDRNGYRGGWYIYGFAYDYAVRPNKKLLPDGKLTDELWLVPYNKDQWTLDPEIVGKFFYLNLNIENREGKVYVGRRVVVENSQPLRLNAKTVLSPGYWLFTLDPFHYKDSVKQVTLSNMEKLTHTQYKEYKKINASLLSVASQHW